MELFEKIKYSFALLPFERFILLLFFFMIFTGNIYKGLKNENREESSNYFYEEDNFKININSAPLESLILIPGIGEKTARVIINLREREKFKNYDDLLKVKGIGKKKLEKIKDYIIFK